MDTKSSSSSSNKSAPGLVSEIKGLRRSSFQAELTQVEHEQQKLAVKNHKTSSHHTRMDIDDDDDSEWEYEVKLIMFIFLFFTSYI